MSHSPPNINDIRRQFIAYFEARGHQCVPSAPLVPDNDDTLLFTNAGMVQFKNALLGLETRAYRRAVTSQKCLRVSGKHNDLEEVGVSPRHHTFFEMLGNFSFGDYFKAEAVQFAWTLLVEEWGLPLERLWFSVYADDEEAAQLWRDVGAAPDRILSFGRQDNWWSMGETGPCGPCSEIHYYWGDLARQQAQGVNRDDEYLEFWNLVFMQYDQVTPTTLEPLPQPGVDTGAGLERVASMLQGCDNTYDTDAFLSLMDLLQQLAGQTDAQRAAHLVAYRVIADHSRAIAFLIADGVLPGNEGRPYITRLILRRAARFGRALNLRAPFMARMAEGVIDDMGAHYRELRQRKDLICETVTAEETRFLQTLHRGLGHLDAMVAENKAQRRPEISGAQSFLLWDTFGFPLDLTRDLAREQGLAVNEEEFRALSALARERSRQAAHAPQGTPAGAYGDALRRLQTRTDAPAAAVKHLIFDAVTAADTRVLALLADGQALASASPGTAVELVVAETPFYVEAGGQMGDTGIVSAGADARAPWTLQVDGVRRPLSGLIVHEGRVLAGEPRVGDAARCEVDPARRRAIERNHTATHLLHATLRARLGSAVHQAGSLVGPERLRFDFTWPRALTAQEIADVQATIQAAILADHPVTSGWEPYADAVAAGAMALFGEKYADVVRVIRIGSGPYLSQELCGGMHVASTSAIGAFYIVRESSSAAGQRRIEAVTGQAANQYVQTALDRLDQAAALLKTQPDMIASSVQSLLDQNSRLRKERQASQRAQAQAQIERLLNQSQTIAGVPCILQQVQAQDVETMRSLCDLLQDRRGPCVIGLAALINGRPMLVVAVSQPLAASGLHAGALVRHAAPSIGGGGGGRQNLAQAGGKQAGGLSAALQVLESQIAAQLEVSP